MASVREHTRQSNYFFKTKFKIGTAFWEVQMADGAFTRNLSTLSVSSVVFSLALCWHVFSTIGKLKERSERSLPNRSTIRIVVLNRVGLNLVRLFAGESSTTRIALRRPTSDRFLFIGRKVLNSQNSTQLCRRSKFNSTLFHWWKPKADNSINKSIFTNLFIYLPILRYIIPNFDTKFNINFHKSVI